MSSINLTRTEAQQRSEMLQVNHYTIDLDLTGEEKFNSRTVVEFEVKKKGSTFIDLRADELRSARLDGEALPVSYYSAKAGIPLHSLSEGSHTLEVEAAISYSRTGEGLHRFTDPADGETYLYTQFQTADAKRVFACFDQPDLKATYSLRFTTPENWTVITNSPVTRSGNTWTAEIDYQLSTYLVALCAGPYVGVEDTWTGELTAHPEGKPAQKLEVPLGIYCRASLADALDSERLFTETKQGFDWYHRNFGFAYPFGKYDQIFVPEFNAGAMENAGCVTIRDEYVFTSKATHYQYELRADTVLHELAHMWFGDLVTMQWWDDLWLNESFATWAAAISQAEETEYDTAWVTFANTEKAGAYRQDQLPTTHPISTDASDIETVEQNFDGITYAKGASALKQLQAYVGREEFLAGVRRHFTEHAWGNATFADLLRHLEEASGRDLSFWANQWLKTTGVNTLRPDFVRDEGKIQDFSVVQSGDTLRTHRIAIGAYSLVDGKVVRTHRVEVDISGELTEVDEMNGIEADLVIVNDDDLTYALLEFDAESLDFVKKHIADFSDPMARTLCWSAAWEMTRGASMRARDFVGLVARGAQAETELAVLERLISQAVTAQTRFADPEWAQEDTQLADCLLSGAKSADPERAIIYQRAMTEIKLTPATYEFLNEKLAETSDANLRWRMLTALIADASVTDPQAAVAAELERDNTATGYQASLKALAAINEPGAKRAVWEEIVAGGLGNRDLTSKLAGLTFTGAEKLLPSAEFFDVAEKLWDTGSNEVALTTVGGLFPTWDVTQENLDRAEAFLARDIPSGLRRAVTEERDHTARALRNRTFDAA
ncbi:aminopeptidase N [Corynebacterium phocae]|uniref:Aminopeptidase N n=1 Tax=Corynebacterium phocae TaxID=161895 RepID=A0A1L7D1V5_9CORY|nr:aminopeptidase N [Corynebacterium phocae]APT92053.1 aminopeptidase N [Corynebacterium phocae]KAA8726436.1 aminopeptidase N [Corynebacterium phocae]